MAGPTDAQFGIRHLIRAGSQPSRDLFAQDGESLPDYLSRSTVPAPNAGAMPYEPDEDPEHQKHRSYVADALARKVITPEMWGAHDALGGVLEGAGVKGNLSGNDLLNYGSTLFAFAGLDGNRVRDDAVAMLNGDRVSADMNDPRHADAVNWMRDSVLDVMQSGTPQQVFAKFDPMTQDEFQQRNYERDGYGGSMATPGTQENFERQWAYDVLRTTHDGSHKPPYLDSSHDVGSWVGRMSGDRDSTQFTQEAASRDPRSERMWLSNYWAARGYPGSQNSQFWYDPVSGAKFPDWSPTNFSGMMKKIAMDNTNVVPRVMSADARYVQQGSRGLGNIWAANDTMSWGDRPQPVLPKGVDRADAATFGNLVHNFRNDDAKNRAWLGSHWPNMTVAAEAIGRSSINAQRAEAGGQPIAGPDWSQYQFGYAPPAVDMIGEAAQTVASPISLATMGAGTALAGGRGALAAGRAAAGTGAARAAEMMAGGAEAMGRTMRSLPAAMGANALDETKEEAALQLATSGGEPSFLASLLSQQPENDLMVGVDGTPVPAQHPSTLDPIRADARRRQERDNQEDVRAYLRIKNR